MESNSFIDILNWAYEHQEGFTMDQLYKKFNNLDKNWYLRTFRGATNNDDCLIGILKYDEKEDTYYYHLTARGISAYMQAKNLKEKRWWEQTWIQILVLLGAIAGIISILK
ncbi:MAG: hypothetical protein Q8N61_00895 [bacterium]|nr:hypothetical protein [bacterium]